jgi:hypothetical protein
MITIRHGSQVRGSDAQWRRACRGLDGRSLDRHADGEDRQHDRETDEKDSARAAPARKVDERGSGRRSGQVACPRREFLHWCAHDGGNTLGARPFGNDATVRLVAAKRRDQAGRPVRQTGFIVEHGGSAAIG